MIGRHRHLRRPASRRGLTLIEMMLAAMLGMVLLGGVYGALTQSWRYTTQGKLEAERNQIARAVLRRIELDIRAAMFDPEAAAATTETSTTTTTSSTSTTGSTGSSSSTSGSSSTDASSGSTTIAGATATDDVFTGSLGIRGSSTELWIDLSHVQRDLVFPDPTIIRGGDLQTVCWFLNGPGSLLGESASSTTTSSGFTRVDLDGVNLARSQGDRSVLRTLNAGGDSDSVLPGPTQIVAGEINALTFRYFDGLTWYDEWDSSTTTALPRAIEVTLGFDPPSNADGPLLTSEVSAATASFRMVIVVPASNPAPPEDI
ncbi:MAG: prepilin-type N-terminal cleavage/methylation domain-containing protein [Planctomycetaceae bacterium]|nr:prepilin-type N-terminal cleavage/methylation domain-containing protein [Planctomycetaceae bacterium]